MIKTIAILLIALCTCGAIISLISGFKLAVLLFAVGGFMSVNTLMSQLNKESEDDAS